MLSASVPNLEKDKEEEDKPNDLFSILGKAKKYEKSI